jgi:hypothetical protein
VPRYGSTAGQAFRVKPIDPTILVLTIEHLRRDFGSRAE